MEIVRPLSPATPDCIRHAHLIFKALQDGRCALGHLEKLVSGYDGLPREIKEVGGMVTKIALRVVGNPKTDGILVLRRAICSPLTSALRIFPGGKMVNAMINSGNYDLPGGMHDPGVDSCPVDAGFREVHEETGLSSWAHTAYEIGAVGCGILPNGVAVVRLGMTGRVDSGVLGRFFEPSPEHTEATIMCPDDPRFPVQWRELGKIAMAA